MKYLFTGATPDNLASGRPLAPGDVVDLTKPQAAANARLIRSGLLLPAPRKPRQRTKSK